VTAPLLAGIGGAAAQDGELERAAALNRQVVQLYRAGHYVEATPLAQEALAIREKALGPDHPAVGTTNNLALLYQSQDRFAEAEPLYKRSLAIREKALGPDHPDVAIDLDNLAWLYRAQGRFAEALAMSGRAIDIVEHRIAVASSARSAGNAGTQRQFRGLFLLHVALAYRQDNGGAGSMSEGFRVAQLAGTSSAAQAVAGMAARFAAGNDALAALVREQQDQAQQWQRLDGAIIQAAAKPPARRNTEAEAALRARLADTVTHLDALDARVTRDFPA
jgi:tetratricopeptide (TPR) repeat protein